MGALEARRRTEREGREKHNSTHSRAQPQIIISLLPLERNKKNVLKIRLYYYYTQPC